MVLTYMSEGFVVTRNLANKALFKEYYLLEPSMAQKMNLIHSIPTMFKLFIGIFIDSKVVKKRKTLFIGACLVHILAYSVQAFAKLPLGAFMVMITLNTLVSMFQDTALESICIQQARKDPIGGQQDF